jgi:hypothetical protein
MKYNLTDIAEYLKALAHHNGRLHITSYIGTYTGEPCFSIVIDAQEPQYDRNGKMVPHSYDGTVGNIHLSITQLKDLKDYLNQIDL